MLGGTGEGEGELCWRTCRGPTLPPPPCHSRGEDLRPVPVRTSKAEEEMGNMATEITAFLLTISGWILVSSTLPTDYWKVSSVDGTVITTATFWSNLWKTCVTDSTGVSNCKDFPSMLALDGESCCPFWGLCACVSFRSIWLDQKKNTCWFRMNQPRCKQIEPDISCSDSGFRLQTTTAFKVKGQWRHVSVNEQSWTEWSNLRKSSSQTEVTPHYLLVTTRKGSAIRCSNSNILRWFETFMQSQRYHFLSCCPLVLSRGVPRKFLLWGPRGGATENVGLVSISSTGSC